MPFKVDQEGGNISIVWLINERKTAARYSEKYSASGQTIAELLEGQFGTTNPAISSCARKRI